MNKPKMHLECWSSFTRAKVNSNSQNVRDSTKIQRRRLSLRHRKWNSAKVKLSTRKSSHRQLPSLKDHSSLSWAVVPPTLLPWLKVSFRSISSLNRRRERRRLLGLRGMRKHSILRYPWEGRRSKNWPSKLKSLTKNSCILAKKRLILTVEIQGTLLVKLPPI